MTDYLQGWSTYSWISLPGHDPDAATLRTQHQVPGGGGMSPCCFLVLCVLMQSFVLSSDTAAAPLCFIIIKPRHFSSDSFSSVSCCVN